MNTRSGEQKHTEQVFHNQDKTYSKGIPIRELNKNRCQKEQIWHYGERI